MSVDRGIQLDYAHWAEQSKLVFLCKGRVTGWHEGTESPPVLTRLPAAAIAERAPAAAPASE